MAELNSVHRRSQAKYPLVQTSYSLRYLQAYPKSGALPRKMPTDPVVRMQLKKEEPKEWYLMMVCTKYKGFYGVMGLGPRGKKKDLCNPQRKMGVATHFSR